MHFWLYGWYTGGMGTNHQYGLRVGLWESYTHTHTVLWNWSYRWLWATMLVWELGLDPLQGTSPQPVTTAPLSCQALSFLFSVLWWPVISLCITKKKKKMALTKVGSSISKTITSPLSQWLPQPAFDSVDSTKPLFVNPSIDGHDISVTTLEIPVTNLWLGSFVWVYFVFSFE